MCSGQRICSQFPSKSNTECSPRKARPANSYLPAILLSSCLLRIQIGIEHINKLVPVFIDISTHSECCCNSCFTYVQDQFDEIVKQLLKNYFGYLAGKVAQDK